jgi:hypothetical protein
MTIGLILTFIFLILKLTGRIDWNLGIIFLPAIIELLIAVAVARFPVRWRGRRH